MPSYPENELYHFGIKGMKWGVRRYQNEDGTLTKAGIRKYGSPEQEFAISETNMRRRHLANYLSKPRLMTKSKTIKAHLEKKLTRLDNQYNREIKLMEQARQEKLTMDKNAADKLYFWVEDHFC